MFNYRERPEEFVLVVRWKAVVPVGDDVRRVIRKVVSLGLVLQNDTKVFRYIFGLESVLIDNIHKHPPVHGRRRGFNFQYSFFLHQESCIVLTPCSFGRNSIDFDIWKVFCSKELQVQTSDFVRPIRSKLIGRRAQDAERGQPQRSIGGINITACGTRVRRCAPPERFYPHF
jgi:hypothetical protein